MRYVGFPTECCVDGELPRERKGFLRFADRIPLLYIILKPYDLLIIYSNEIIRGYFLCQKNEMEKRN